MGNGATSADSARLEVVDRHPFVAFIIATYAFSWLFWSPSVLGLVEYTSLGGMLLAVPGAFGPGVGAAIVTWGRGRSVRSWFFGLWKWRIRLRWYLIALGLPPAVLITAATAHVLVGGASFGIGPEVALAGYPLSVLSIALLGGGQEEWGWRGFGLPVLRKKMSALWASAIIAVVWGVWHLPLFLIPGSDQDSLPVLLYIPALVFASIILTWLYESGGRSIIPAMLLHGGFNAAAYYPAGGYSVALTTTAYGLIIAVYGVVALAIALGPMRQRQVEDDASDAGTASSLAFSGTRSEEI